MSSRRRPPSGPARRCTRCGNRPTSSGTSRRTWSIRCIRPALREFLDHVDVAIAVHGFGRQDMWATLLLGGGNRELAATLGAELTDRLPQYTVLDEIEAIPDPAARAAPRQPGQPAQGRWRAARTPAPRARHGSVLEGVGGHRPHAPHRSADRRPGRYGTVAVTVELDRRKVRVLALDVRVRGMDLRIFVEPQQGASYEQQLAVAQLAEQLGFDAFFRSDHLLVIGSPPANPSGVPGPTDSWVTLGAIARETSTIRLGTMVTSATFRMPGPLAIAVAQVDAMSNGRVELGIGAGWYDTEHLAYGVPFPVDQRTLRAARGTARDHHRPVALPDRLAVQLRGQALHDRRLTGAPQARAGRRSAGHHRRVGPQAHAAVGRRVRGRVQRAVLARQCLRRSVRQGSRRVHEGGP